VLGVPRYLEKEGVVGVGEIGYDDMTAAEESAFERQVAMAAKHELVVLVHTPHRDKRRGTERSLDLIRSLGFPVERVLIDHNNEETLPIVLDSGCWASPQSADTKMDEVRWSRWFSGTASSNHHQRCGLGSERSSEVRTAAAMRAAGIPERDIETIVWENPIRFFSTGGRLDRGDLESSAAVDQRELWQGNSVLRGQEPRVGR
jgi:predicted metal-dependent TIM-barrel fold hydrolase